MKLLSLAAFAALAAASIAVPTAASARPHHEGWNGHHHQRCWTEWRHHHKVRRCR